MAAHLDTAHLGRLALPSTNIAGLTVERGGREVPGRGLARRPRLVSSWTTDGAGRLVCTWRQA
jgi:hypothetical protein